ncbi:hypothetical protein D3C77_579370 [compost metagenome]
MRVTGGLIQAGLTQFRPVLFKLAPELIIANRPQGVLIDPQDAGILVGLVPRHRPQLVADADQKVSGILEIAVGIPGLNAQPLQEALAARVLAQKPRHPLKRAAYLVG